MKYTTKTLITAALEEQNVFPLRRINLQIFNDVEQSWLMYIFQYIKKHKAIPTLDIFKSDNPTFIADSREDTPLSYIFDKVIPPLQRKYVENKMAERKENGQSPFDIDWLDGLVKETMILPDQSINFRDIHPSAYFTDLKTIKSTLKYIHTALGEIVADDYILFVGRMKNQKTHTSRFLAYDLIKQGYNCLIFTNEISPQQYAAQLDALIGGVNPRIFRTRQATEEQMKRLEDGYLTRQHPSFGEVYISGRIDSVAEIYSALNYVKFPVDFIVIDGLHLMGGRGSRDIGEKSQSLRNVSNDVKAFTLQMQIPIIGVSQSNRSASGKSKADDTTIGLTDAFAQDASIVFTCHKTDVEDEDVNGIPYMREAVEIWPTVNRFGEQIMYYQFTNWDTMEIDFSVNDEKVGPDGSKDGVSPYDEDVSFD